MLVVGLKVLKNRLSEYVRLAEGGERVLVTDRDRVVAELIAPQSGTPEFAADAMLAAAVRSGWLRPPLGATREPPKSLPIMPLAELLKELEEDREDR